MTATILIALGALIGSVVTGALLAPFSQSAERIFCRSARPQRLAPKGMPFGQFCPR